MSSKTAKPVVHSAAWRISLVGDAGLCLRQPCWSSFCCTALSPTTFSAAAMRGFRERLKFWAMSPSGRRRTLSTDGWWGKWPSWPARKFPTGTAVRKGNANDSVFFLQTGGDGSLKLWVGAGGGEANLQGNSGGSMFSEPSDGSCSVQGFAIPFRVASIAHR